MSSYHNIVRGVVSVWFVVPKDGKVIGNFTGPVNLPERDQENSDREDEWQPRSDFASEIRLGI